MPSRFVGVSASVIVVFLGLTLLPRTWSQDARMPLKVVRVMDDGRVYYQTVGLRGAEFRFSEDRKQVECEGELVHFSYDRDAKGHLTEFRLGLRAQPQVWLPAPENSQAAALPGSRSTGYYDIDGDSELDVRIRQGPGLQETAVLHEDRWVKVGNTKTKIGVGTIAYALDGQRFRFEKGKWNLLAK